MTDRTDIPEGRLIYSCNCGWLDLGHAGTASERAFVGAERLWAQFTNPNGPVSKHDASGYKVTYVQDAFGPRKTKMWRSGHFFVRSNLSLSEQEAVALAIFMDISHKFEYAQSWVLFRDSGYSVEDLVSNLLGFYSVVRPDIDYKKLCQLVSETASLDVWDNHGHPGSDQNETFEPVYYPCTECGDKKPRFPRELQQIVPTVISEKGTSQMPPEKPGPKDLVRFWTRWDDDPDGARAHPLRGG